MILQSPSALAPAATPPRAAARTRRIMFVYWGRRGAMPLFTLQLARAARTVPGLHTTIGISRQNAMFDAYPERHRSLLAVETFTGNSGALTQCWRLPALRRAIATHLAANEIEAVVDLMPHVWSSFIATTVRSAGARYLAVVHDADPHPGDATSWVKRVTDRGMSRANAIITLSGAVAGRLAGRDDLDPARIVALFHPDLELTSTPPPPRTLIPGEPVRLMFLGRIMAYKGLGRFLDTIELLRAQGFPVAAGVFGEGNLAPYRHRLAALNAEVANRWLPESEIASILPRYHAVVLAHTEASQSGVAAIAFGAGLPVVSTPAGGLREQVIDGVTGTLAATSRAEDLAAAVQRLFATPQSYAAISASIAGSRPDRSMRRFVERVAAIAIP